jgi:hypothetical protein
VFCYRSWQIPQLVVDYGAVQQVKWRKVYSDLLRLATTSDIATDTNGVRHCGREEEVMQGRQRRQSWVLIWLVLVLAVPALAQVVRVGGEGQPQPETRVQVTQNLTIAVCGDTCDCGSATLMSKESAPCTAQSSTGSCQVGGGECCVCAAANTIAVCGDTCSDFRWPLKCCNFNTLYFGLS